MVEPPQPPDAEQQEVMSTLKGVALLYASALTLSALAITFAEGWPILDAIWWASVTATTVGYGDLTPATGAGRVIAVVVMHLGPGFCFPIATALMASKLIVDHDAFTHDEQEQLKIDLRRVRELLEKEHQ